MSTSFVPRTIDSRLQWQDSAGTKIYTVSITGTPVDRSPYEPRLAAMKAVRNIDWPRTAAFAIFHEAALRYLVLAWWGNDNELFTAVSVQEAGGWVEDPARYSFCVWDLQIIWHERNAFIDLVYRPRPDLDAYRARLLPRLDREPQG